MKPKTLRSIIGVLLVFLFLISCNKDFDKIKLPVYSPNLMVPLLQTALSLEDVIDTGENIQYDNNGLFHFVYSDDSIISINVSDIVTFPEQTPDSKHYQLGNIRVPYKTFSNSNTLGELINYIDPVTKAWFEANDGTSQIVAPFASTSSKITNENIDFINNVHLESGEIIFEITNSFPFDIIMNYGIRNNGEATYIAQVTNFLIPANTRETSTIDISGKDISGTVDLVIISFGSPGTASPVDIDLSDQISFYSLMQNMETSSGSAKIQEQVFKDDVLTFNFEVNTGYEIEQIDFKNTTLNYTITSNIQTDILVAVKLPETKYKSNDLEFKDGIIVSYNGGAPQQGSIDLSDTYTIFNNPNEFTVLYQVSLFENNNFVPFTSTDDISIDMGLSTVDYTLVKGTFGSEEFTVDPDQMDFEIDFFNKLDGALEFENPTLTLTYQNSIGMPIAMVLDLVGEDKEGTQQALNYLDNGNDTLYFNSPTIVGETYNGEIVFDNDNSDIGDILSLPPVQLNYAGTVVSNTFGEASSNFVTDTSSFILGFEMDVPVSIKADNIVFQDTIDIDIEDDLGEDIVDADITAVIQNGFPFDLELSLILVDSVSPSTFNILETINIGDVASATVDASGNVTEPSTNELNVSIGQTTFDNLQLANKAFIVANGSTYNDGQQPVKLYSTYNVIIGLGLRVMFNLQDD